MSSRKRKNAPLRALSSELGDDDGVDPREFFRPTGRRRNDQRRTGQLCRQVAETLSLVLAGEFDDPRLHNLQVVSVTAIDGSSLLVNVAYEGPPDAAHAAEVQSRLLRVAGRLRTEVAAAITRKRAPRLVFRVIASVEEDNQ